MRSIWTHSLGALALGGLLVINTWDIAPFWLLYVGLSLYAALRSQWCSRWRWAASCQAGDLPSTVILMSVELPRRAAS